MGRRSNRWSHWCHWVRVISKRRLIGDRGLAAVGRIHAWMVMVTEPPAAIAPFQVTVLVATVAVTIPAVTSRTLQAQR